MEYSIVTIGDDLNKSCERALSDLSKFLDKYPKYRHSKLSDLPKRIRDIVEPEILLYYVACSRAQCELHNAIHLDQLNGLQLFSKHKKEFICSK